MSVSEILHMPPSKVLTDLSQTELLFITYAMEEKYARR